MTQTIKQVLTVAALFLANTVGWAAPTVNITKMINGDGIGDSNPGEVSSSITDGICTLTVIPATDFYATAENITALATVSSSMAQGTQRVPDINDGHLEVTATNSSADPSGKTTYTFTMPTDESIVEVTVDFQYRISISDAEVTLAKTSMTYTGEALEPAVSSVTLGNDVISSDNYTVAYSNNTNVGTATVTITGVRTYSGTATATFTIIQNIASELAGVLTEVNSWVTFLPKQTLTVPTGVEAYVVTGINLETRTVTATKLNYLPAGVPVLLEKTGTEIGAASLYTGTTSDVTCILQSSGENGTTVADNSTTSYYILYKDEYVKVTRGTTIAANKYYLTATGTNAPSRLMIIGSDSDVTAIKSITNNSLTTGDNIIYDLQGRRILHPVKGQLYIVNGKKVVLK